MSDRGQRVLDTGENAAAAAGAKEDERAAADGEGAGEADSRSAQPAEEEVMMRARPRPLCRRDAVLPPSVPACEHHLVPMLHAQACA